MICSSGFQVSSSCDQSQMCILMLFLVDEKFLSKMFHYLRYVDQGQWDWVDDLEQAWKMWLWMRVVCVWCKLVEDMYSAVYEYSVCVVAVPAGWGGDTGVCGAWGEQQWGRGRGSGGGRGTQLRTERHVHHELHEYQAARQRHRRPRRRRLRLRTGHRW
jgi:hypothetical protein